MKQCVVAWSDVFLISTANNTINQSLEELAGENFEDVQRDLECIDRIMSNGHKDGGGYFHILSQHNFVYCHKGYASFSSTKLADVFNTFGIVLKDYIAFLYVTRIIMTVFCHSFTPMLA